MMFEREHAGVYYIRNKVNGKMYIGRSDDVPRRIKDHIGKLRQGTHPKHHMQAEWNVVGESNFEIGVLAHVYRWVVNQRIGDVERQYIRAYRAFDPECGYNANQSEIARMTNARKPKARRDGMRLTFETTAERNAYILSQFAAKTSPSDIAAAVGITRARLYQIVNQANSKTPA